MMNRYQLVQVPGHPFYRGEREGGRERGGERERGRERDRKRGRERERSKEREGERDRKRGREREEVEQQIMSYYLEGGACRGVASHFSALRLW